MDDFSKIRHKYEEADTSMEDEVVESENVKIEEKISDGNE
jgi:hypothetical protein